MLETESLVTRVNPSVKLILHLACMFFLVFAGDWQTTLCLALIPIAITLFIARISLKKFLIRTSPFLISFLATTWMFAAYGKGQTVWWEWGWIRITAEGLDTGLEVGLRMLGFVAYGFLFASTTDITGLMLSLMQQGQLRVLAVTTAKRTPAAPNVPTLAEAGVPGFDVAGWYAFFVPAKTPSEIVRKMHADTVAVLAEPAIKRRLEELGLFVVGSTPEELGKFHKAEMDKWEPVIKEAGISIRE